MKQFTVLVLTSTLLVAITLIWTSGQKSSNEAAVYDNFETSEAFDTENPRHYPVAKMLNSNYHVFQTFNNCGPASLSMALSYYGISVSQKELGDDLRPYQNSMGDNDDKSVTLEELAEKSEEYGLVAIYRPGGNIELIKKLIAQDLPVITKTWLKKDDDIGHYRVVKGYDDEKKEIIQDDSLQGKNLRYTYSDFNEVWNKFNYEYLVLVPESKYEMVIEILGENADVKQSWQLAAEKAQEEFNNNSSNHTQAFNLVVALHNLGKHKESVELFEKIKDKLPKRTLWYQAEPILSYYELEMNEKVFSITNEILNNGNRAYSELYYIRGNVYMRQGKTELAKSEYEKALLYNKNYKAAKAALEKLP